MHADSVQMADWWARSRGAQSANWVENYQRSVEARHRKTLSDVVRSLGAKTVLEVGCHCGPNLVRLATDDPAIEAIGIDASAEAITAGRQWVRGRGLEGRVQLNAVRFPEGTAAIASGTFDVVFSCYTLAYLAPSDLDAALYEMGRLAARALIIAEPMPYDGQRPATIREIGGYGEWAHDYQAALEWIGNLRGVKTRIVPVTPAVDRLNAILVVEREGPREPNSQ